MQQGKFGLLISISGLTLTVTVHLAICKAGRYPSKDLSIAQDLDKALRGVVNGQGWSSKQMRRVYDNVSSIRRVTTAVTRSAGGSDVKNVNVCFSRWSGERCPRSRTLHLLSFSPRCVGRPWPRRNNNGFHYLFPMLTVIFFLC